MKAERWVILVAAMAAAALTARLGFWQLDRATQKTRLQQDLDQRRVLPRLHSTQLATDAATAASQHHRTIELRGRWSDDATLYLDNRPMEGRTGFIVVTPLVLADGSAVIVQRGWLPRDPVDRTRVQAPPLPPGEVVVEGRIAPPPSRLLEMGPAASGPIRQNLHLGDLAREWRLALRPLSVLQEGVAGGDQAALQRRWSAPAADVHKHYGYAAQWFALSALVMGLYVWFQLVRPRRIATRRP